MPDPVFILIDTSGSMSTPVARMQMRPRIELLTDALASVLKGFPDARLFAFSDVIRELEGYQQEAGLVLPEPDGGTDLTSALMFVTTRRPMRRLVVLSDGLPYDPEAALAAARAMAPQTIDCIHIGDEDDRPARAFMRKLSLAGGTGRGRWAIGDLTRPDLLGNEIRKLLTWQPKS